MTFGIALYTESAWMKIRETLRKPLCTALVFTLCAVWLLSGIPGGGDDGQASVASSAEAQDDMVVRERTSRASEQSRTLTLRGRPRTRHAVIVRAETSGRVDNRLIDQPRRNDRLASIRFVRPALSRSVASASPRQIAVRRALGNPGVDRPAAHTKKLR